MAGKAGAGAPVPKPKAAAGHGVDWRLLAVLACVYGGLVSDRSAVGEPPPPPPPPPSAAAACAFRHQRHFPRSPSQLLTTIHFFALVPEPLPADADPTRFSEGRAFRHLDILAGNIGHRQVCGTLRCGLDAPCAARF